MDEPNQPFQPLVRRCCATQQDRQRCLEQLIKELLASGKLWHRPSDIPEADYEDILQKSWIYFCCNLCEAATAATPYNPERSSLPTWINAHIRWRILDYRLEKSRENQIRAQGKVMHDGSEIDPIPRIPASPDPPPILQDVQAWLERDVQILRRVHLRDRPDINCYTLIPRRLPPETCWKQLAQTFEITESTLQGFYRRECLPRLRAAGRELGYL